MFKHTSYPRYLHTKLISEFEKPCIIVINYQNPFRICFIIWFYVSKKTSNKLSVCFLGVTLRTAAIPLNNQAQSVSFHLRLNEIHSLYNLEIWLYLIVYQWLQ